MTKSRLRRRYSPDQDLALSWHLSRFAELSHHLADVDLDELVVTTDDRSPGDIARQVLTHFGVIPPTNSEPT